MRVSFPTYYLFITVLLSNYTLNAQIAPTDSLLTRVIHPSYPKNKGPEIFIDEGHYNRHTYGGLGGFKAFKHVLNEDGYRVVILRNRFTSEKLKQIKILVIPLAQDKRNLWPRWHVPIYSAFHPSEIALLKNWVEAGGSLFLITDHHPFAGAVKKLAEEFDFILYNGHVEDTTRYPAYFNRANNTLHSNVITNGRNNYERIDSIISYNGCAIKIPEGAVPIIAFNDTWIQWLPDTAWNFKNIKPVTVSGLAQGAFKRIGKGKLMIFGDGNMFSAQVTDAGEKMGFLDPLAKDNYKLLLNVIHYLDGSFD